MIDSHCHLDQEPLLSNLNQVISRSKLAGIEKILTISTNNDSFIKILKIVELNPIIYGTYGIHPHETQNDIIDIESIINKVNLNKKIIGVGETGLDYYYNNSDKKSQISSFRNHIEASLKLNIPLIVHSRNAENETYEILKDYESKNLKILMHCFTGSYNFAKNLIKYNTFFSASGIITFKNSIDLQNTFSKMPLDNLLIETDSPFLSPVPMRGKKNEPSYIKYTLDKLAELKKVDSKKIDEITTNNFNKLFFN